MINAMFAAPVAAMLALALVPTVIHSYLGLRVEDGLRAERVASRLDGADSSATARKAAWVANNFETDDWIERTYPDNGLEATLFVARSYDAKRLYHHPELAILRGTQTTPRGVMRSRVRPDIPLHVIEVERNGQTGVAVYALRYDRGYIDNPVLFQLRTSVALLVSGRKPMTLFMTSALAGSPDDIDQAPATRLLLAAIADFERQAAGAPTR